MTPRSAPDLIADLKTRTQDHLARVRALALLSDEALHLRPRPDAWNALECIAHLNHYADFYQAEIRRRTAATKHRADLTTFTSSWLGNKFAAGMKPGPKTRKVKTFKNANPVNFGREIGRDELDKFAAHLEDLLALLEDAAAVDLTRTKVSTSISPLLRLRLGDALRTVIYHNWRHVAQAEAAAATA